MYEKYYFVYFMNFTCPSISRIKTHTTFFFTFGYN